MAKISARGARKVAVARRMRPSDGYDIEDVIVLCSDGRVLSRWKSVGYPHGGEIGSGYRVLGTIHERKYVAVEDMKAFRMKAFRAYCDKHNYVIDGAG